MDPAGFGYVYEFARRCGGYGSRKPSQYEELSHPYQYEETEGKRKGFARSPFLLMSVEVAVELPLADAVVVAFPLFSFHLDVVACIFLTQGLADYIVHRERLDGSLQVCG